MIAIRTVAVWSVFSALITPSAVRAERPQMIFRDSERVLFQGDSITDGGRGRGTDPNHILGHSYVFLIAAPYGAAHPQQFVTFINRGVSGNRVDDLTKRWKPDALDLKPDVVSILVGINDILLAFKAGKELSPAAYEAAYDRLLADTTAARPGVRLILLEPFTLPGRWTVDRPADWARLTAALRESVHRLGQKYHAPVVPLQKVFDDAVARAPVGYWIWDGIHPTYAGHQLIADAWVDAYRQFYGVAATTRPATP